MPKTYFSRFEYFKPQTRSGYDSDEITPQHCDLTPIAEKRFDDRDNMIDFIRIFSKEKGFNICIPRGDIKLNDGTEQVTLY